MIYAHAIAQTDGNMRDCQGATRGSRDDWGYLLS